MQKTDGAHVGATTLYCQSQSIHLSAIQLRRDRSIRGQQLPVDDTGTVSPYTEHHLTAVEISLGFGKGEILGI